MYSSILVVGGGLMFHGAQEFLLHRIMNKMPPSFRRLVDNVEVITRPKVTGDMLVTVTQYTVGPRVLSLVLEIGKNHVFLLQKPLLNSCMCPTYSTTLFVINRIFKFCV